MYEDRSTLRDKYKYWGYAGQKFSSGIGYSFYVKLYAVDGIYLMNKYMCVLQPNNIYMGTFCIRISQIPTCIRQMSHDAPICNRYVHACAYFCYKIVYCEI